MRRWGALLSLCLLASPAWADECHGLGANTWTTRESESVVIQHVVVELTGPGYGYVELCVPALVTPTPTLKRKINRVLVGTVDENVTLTFQGWHPDTGYLRLLIGDRTERTQRYHVAVYYQPLARHGDH